VIAACPIVNFGPGGRISGMRRRMDNVDLFNLLFFYSAHYHQDWDSSISH
jgi:hypothetical protein